MSIAEITATMTQLIEKAKLEAGQYQQKEAAFLAEIDRLSTNPGGPTPAEWENLKFLATELSAGIGNIVPGEPAP